MADLKTYQISGVLAYDVTPNVKVYGGLRAQLIEAKAAVSFVQNYSVDADNEWGYGYLLGAAYERPEIALRVALTYHSKISYDLSTAETIIPFATGVPQSQDTNTDVDTPAVGAARLPDRRRAEDPGLRLCPLGRLVGVRDQPAGLRAGDRAADRRPRPLVDYADDWWTYNLGIGRQLTDALAGSFSITYEPDVGGEMTSLGPYDGRTTGTAALSYDYGQWNFTGGLTYGVLGDTHNVLQTDYNDGSVWGAGLRVGYTF